MERRGFFKAALGALAGAAGAIGLAPKLKAALPATGGIVSSSPSEVVTTGYYAPENEIPIKGFTYTFSSNEPFTVNSNSFGEVKAIYCDGKLIGWSSTV